MKKLSLLLIILLGFTACEKAEDDSALEGLWQVTHIRSHGEGSVEDEEIYWSLRCGLLQIETKAELLNGFSCWTMAHYQFTGAQFIVTDAYLHDREHDYYVPEESTALQPLGLHGGRTAFDVREFSKRRLVLVSDTDSLVLRKY